VFCVVEVVSGMAVIRECEYNDDVTGPAENVCRSCMPAFIANQGPTRVQDWVNLIGL
jgi:hypothetical protein